MDRPRVMGEWNQLPAWVQQAQLPGLVAAGVVPHDDPVVGDQVWDHTVEGLDHALRLLARCRDAVDLGMTADIGRVEQVTGVPRQGTGRPRDGEEALQVSSPLEGRQATSPRL